MKLNGLMGFVYHAGEWIIRLVYANLLWMIFTLLGLGLFGFMPATVGLFTVIRQWIMGKNDVPAFQIFWETFRRELLRSNLIGVIFLAAGYVLRMDLIFLKSSSNPILHGVLILMLCLGLLYFITLLNFFPVYVHFEIPFIQYFKYALLIGISQLPSTIMMVIGGIVLFCLYWYVSGLMPLLCISLFSLVLMWFGYRGFEKIKYEKNGHPVVKSQG